MVTRDTCFCFVNRFPINIIYLLTLGLCTTYYPMQTKAASMYFWSVSLVYQLSGQFLIFWSTKFFLVYQMFFWSTKFFFWLTKFLFGIPNFFWYTKFFFGRPNFFFGRPKIPRDWPKNPWDWTISFLVDQEKWEKDRTIGRPRDWPKPHGRDWNLTFIRK